MTMQRQRNRARKKWLWIIPVVVLLLSGAAFLVYVEQYYHADEFRVRGIEIR